MDTLHMDLVSPLPSTRKAYKHILTMIDGFTKYVWIFPIKSTAIKEVIEKFRILQQSFRNPRRIISDRGTAFKSNEFEDFCREEQTENNKMTTGVPRKDGQADRVHRTLEEVFMKLTRQEPIK